MEVTEIIIDHLHNDPRSLRACTLVSKQWLPTSRFHLIPRLQVQENFVDSFLELLESPHSQFARSARVLEIANLSTGHNNAWVNRVMPSLVKHLGHVTSFNLSYVKWGQLTPRAIECMNGFMNIQSLALLDCSFMTLQQLVSFICASQKLRFLHFGRSLYEQDGPQVASSQTISPHLSKLRVDAGPSFFFKWLSSQEAIFLEGIILDPISLENIEDVQRILRRAGPSLTLLKLRFDDQYMQRSGSCIG